MKNIEVEEAIKILEENVTPIMQTESVELLSSLHRVLAETIYAPISVPPFDRSPLDGYAFAAAATAEASKQSPAAFRVVATVFAGDFLEQTIQPGEAVRIMTGAPIPAGCDCVIAQENVTVDGDTLYVPKPMQQYQNYCFSGEDMKKDDLVLSAGELISYIHIGVLASLGYKQVPVYVRPRVAFFCTGDELIEVGEAASPGKIYNSNQYMLAAHLDELGVEPVLLGKMPDDPLAIADLIRANCDSIDLFVSTGGVSVGQRDIIHDVITELGADRLFWKIKAKPGTSVLAYKYQNSLCIGLSGNPFAALATFELLVKPTLAKISRNRLSDNINGKAIMGSEFNKASQRRRYVRAHYDHATGIVTLPDGHSSGMLASARDCNCMIYIVGGTQRLQVGDQVDIIFI